MASKESTKIRDEDLPNKEQLGAQALPPISDVKNRTEFRPRGDMHIAQVGDVVQDNWVGKVDGKRTTVFYGCPVKDLTPAVKKALEQSGIKFGPVTMTQPGAVPGAQVLGVTPREG